MLGKIFKKVNSYIRSKTGVYYHAVMSNPVENIISSSNYAFLNSQDFQKYYDLACNTVGRDFNFPFRIHQALWCASLSLHGDFVELGTGKGFTAGALAPYCLDNNFKGRIFLCDTFLPYKTNQFTGQQNSESKKSIFYADAFEDVEKKFNKYEFVHFVKGSIPNSLTELPNDLKISFQQSEV